MFYKAKPARDAFTFSLGGISTISSFVVAPAIELDRINSGCDERLGKGQKVRPDTTRAIGGIRKYLLKFWSRQPE